MVRHPLEQRERRHGCASHLHRNVNGVFCRRLNGSGASGLLLWVGFGQTICIHDPIECCCVSVDKLQQPFLNRQSLHCICRKLLPLRIPTPLVRTEVRHHRAECCPQSTAVGCNRATAWCRRFGGGLFAERPQVHIEQRRLARFSNAVFNHAFGRVKWSQIIQTQRLHRDLDLLMVRNAQGSLLFPEIVISGFCEHAQGKQADEFRTRHPNSSVTGTLHRFIKGDVHWRHVDVGEVEGQLGNAIFLDVPTNAFDRFQRAWDPHRVACCILDNG